MYIHLILSWSKVTSVWSKVTLAWDEVTSIMEQSDFWLVRNDSKGEMTMGRNDRIPSPQWTVICPQVGSFFSLKHFYVTDTYKRIRDW